MNNTTDDEMRKSLGEFYPAVIEMLDASNSEKDPRKRKIAIRKIAEEFADGTGIQT